MTVEVESPAELEARHLAEVKKYMQQIPGTVISFASCHQNEDVVRLVVGDCVENELLLKGHLVMTVGGLRKLHALCAGILEKMGRADAERAKGLN